MMSERFIIHTVKKSTESVLADYYETTIYDHQTGIMVTCAGNTPVDSEENATVYLAALNAQRFTLRSQGGDG